MTMNSRSCWPECKVLKEAAEHCTVVLQTLFIKHLCRETKRRDRSPGNACLIVLQVFGARHYLVGVFSTVGKARDTRPARSTRVFTVRECRDEYRPASPQVNHYIRFYIYKAVAVGSAGVTVKGVLCFNNGQHRVSDPSGGMETCKVYFVSERSSMKCRNMRGHYNFIVHVTTFYIL